jgi:hypothetical protein
MCPVGQHHAQVAGMLGSPRPSRVSRDPHHVHPSAVEFDEEQHVEPLQQHRVDGEEVAGQNGGRLASNELIPAGTFRIGDGSTLCRSRMAQTLEGAKARPILASSPWIRRYPQVGFSRASRRMIVTVPAGMLGRPGRWA